jgi:hypothetical protein
MVAAQNKTYPKTSPDGIRPSFIKDVCSNIGVRNLLNSGIAVRNLTRDMHGVLIYELTVRSADCAR